MKFARIFFLSIGTLILVVVSFVVLSPVVRELDTIYATAFSKDNFEKITLGMTKTEVEQLLGQPLYKTESKNGIDEYWQYTQTGKLGWPDLNDFVGGNYIRIFFDKDGKATARVHHVFN